MKVVNEFFGGLILIVLGVIFWITETVYFVCNTRAMSGAEANCDDVVFSLVFMGLVFTLNAIAKMHR